MTATRRRMIIDTRPEFDVPTEPIVPVQAVPRRQRDITFRTRDPQRRPTNKRKGQRVPPAVLALCALVVVTAALTWAYTGLDHWNATGASGNPTTAASKTTAARKQDKAKSARKRSTRHKTTASTAQTSSRTTAGASTGAKPTTAPLATSRSTAAITTTSRTSAVAVASLAHGDVVVIDAGHQGQGDSSPEPIGPGSSQTKAKVADGASGQYAPHDESEVNLEVALKLQKVLTSRGVKVIMVRTTQNVNISNSQRAEIANKAHAALFIRLHCDGISDSSRHGFSTLIPADNHWTHLIVGTSAKAGRIVHKAALAETGAADAGIVDRGDLSGFNWSKVPTILVEMGFMSNSSEDKALTTSAYQQKLAIGLTNGIVQYLKSR